MAIGIGSVLLLTAFGLTSAALWGYENDGPNKWTATFPTCGGQSQSPINIELSDVKQTNTLTDFTLTGYDTVSTMNIMNNGHTAKINVAGDIYIENGGLPAKYKLAQVHFHWGSADAKGSEHSVNGMAYPMEIHFVHFKDSLGTIGDAISVKDGLAVLGFFFEISDTENTKYNDIISKLSTIGDPTGNTTEAALSPAMLSTLIPSKRNNFFRYDGSLTTPPCSESVVWTLFEETIPLSSAQMAKFRKMYSSEHDAQNNHYHLQNNFRPAQLLNSRMVRSSHFINSATTSFINLYTLFFALFVSVILRK